MVIIHVQAKTISSTNAKHQIEISGQWNWSMNIAFTLGF